MSRLPEGFGIELDRSVRTFRDGQVLVGGHPPRVVTLTPAGAGALATLTSGPAVPVAARDLAGRLVAAGMAHPRWTGDRGPGAGQRTVTIVVPAHDRVAELDRCLDSLTSSSPGIPVLVIDDASADSGSLERVCARHGARVIKRTVRGGPGAARNDALRVVDTELIAFVDSDCTVTSGWLTGLLPLFADPTVGAVAADPSPAWHLSSRRVDAPQLFGQPLRTRHGAGSGGGGCRATGALRADGHLGGEENSRAGWLRPGPHHR